MSVKTGILPLNHDAPFGKHDSGGFHNVAYLPSPIGIMLCRFSDEGFLTECSPLEDDFQPLSSDLIGESIAHHPELTEALRMCAPPPPEYHPILPHSEWAPHFWEILTEVPFGTTLSYGELALLNGLDRKMARAVGRLLVSNPIAILYPCHRIIRADGSLSNYRWGIERKKALIRYEAEYISKNRSNE